MSETILKYCPVCKTEKPLEEFNKHHREKYGRNNICRICQRASNKRYLTTDKGIATTRRAHLRRSYGVDLKTYDDLLKAQGGKCKICGADSNPDSRARHFTIDHNHNTGEIRGLLCTKCNALLGLAKENEELLDKAKQYLHNSRINIS